MKMENLDRLTKSALVLLITGLVFGCDSQPEETVKPNPDMEINTTAEQSNAIAAGAGTEAGPESAEEPRETLESILKRADEVIQRTGSSNSALNEGEDTLPEPGLATVPTIDQGVQKLSSDDDLDVIKTTPELIRKVQQALTDAGFNTGSADGKLGPRTKGALTDFQNQNGLATGKLTKETLRKLAIPF